MRNFTCTLIGFLVALALAAMAPAQTFNTGTVVGRVTDPSGAVVPQATVQLQDQATGTVRTTTTNSAGHYAFIGVVPGTYNVTATRAGFRQGVVTSVDVEVTKSYNINLQLKLGQTRQSVQVHATSAQALQTMDATIGGTISGNELETLPSKWRDTGTLIELQPLVNSGHVSGDRSDQNSFLLDGGDSTDTTIGNSAYFGSSGTDPSGQLGAMPAPIESVQEFRVATSNPNASFVGSSGGQVILMTKRGTDNFHGSAYEYLLNSALDANSWNLNRVGRTKPVTQDNHYGATFGGYIPLPSGKSKTYFFMNYEGRQMRTGQSISRAVPRDSLRNGILTFPDANGNMVSYDLATATDCGPAGNLPCDPRGLGMNPLIHTLWNKYMPEPNSFGGDPNSASFVGYLPLPISSQFGVIRLDHSFGEKWQAVGTYHYFTASQASNYQWDIGGLVPGGSLGQPHSVANHPRDPRMLTFGLTGLLTSNLTNEFSMSYMRDNWEWDSAQEFPQVPGTAAALVGNLMNPLNFNAMSIRERAMFNHRLGIREDLAWQKGNHLLRFGWSDERNAVYFWRTDSMGTNVWPSYNVGASGCAWSGQGGGGCGITIPDLYLPPICSSTLTTNCLPSAQINNWLNYYSQSLGMVESATQFRTRAADLSALPSGSPLSTNVRYSLYSTYATDTWHVRPSLTLQLGINWMIDMPPYATQGKQIIGVTVANGQTQILRDPFAYMSTREQAALNGQVYNPTMGMEPIRYAKLKYPYSPYYGGFAPRVGAAWNPDFTDGFLGRLFGQRKSVFRVGFGQIFDRSNGVQRAIDPLQAFGYGEALACIGPSITGQCLGNGGVDPVTGFRAGVDGSTVPIPQLPAQTTVPFIPGPAGFPGANQPAGYSTYGFQNDYRPARENELDFSIQRALPANSLLEVGYVHRHAKDIYAPIDLTEPPFMMVYGGQSFAKAYDNVRKALLAGTAPTAIPAQPFFEAALAGSSLCNPTCTAGVAGEYAGNFANLGFWSLWNSLQPMYKFGAATPLAQVSDYLVYTHGGIANYDGGFVSYRVRNWKGLNLNANLTYSHSLDDVMGCQQNCDGNAFNSYDLMWDYGNSNFDRTFVFNLYGVYQLPFGQHGGNRFANSIIRGWGITPLFTAVSGTPIHVADGSAGAVLLTKDTFGNSVHSGVTGDATTGVGVGSDPANGGTGLNLFADPNAVYNSFRHFMLSEDTRTNRTGQLRGLPSWSLDMGVQRRFTITEHVSTTFQANFYNVFNHVQFGNPGMNLQSPRNFGVIGGQANTPRNIELSLRLDF